MKVMTIVGTRPELIKMSRVIDLFDRCVDHVLVHTGQNSDHELNAIFFEEMRIRSPDHALAVAGYSPADTIANVISQVDKVLELEQPDAVMLYGDTNSCLSVIAAKRRKIPVFHMEAGSRCFDQRVPEELNRKVVDHLSDVNIAHTEHARRNLLAEGIPSDRVFVVGSPMREVLDVYAADIDSSNVVQRLGVAAGRFVVVSAHREENVDDPERLVLLLASLNAIAEAFSVEVVVSTHPRTRRRIDEMAVAVDVDQRVRFIAPLGLFDYVALQRAALCVVSDSGTVTEESAILGFPAVTLRLAQERPEGMDAGVLMMSDLDPGAVVAAVRGVILRHRGRAMPRVDAYDVTDFSFRVLGIVLSHVDVVRQNVWHQHR